jgi:hypothetical protein
MHSYDRATRLDKQRQRAMNSGTQLTLFEAHIRATTRIRRDIGDRFGERSLGAASALPSDDVQ